MHPRADSAMRFYRAVGFAVEGVDVSYYSNEDYPDGEIAVFMKLRVV
jgi:streptothricin acetyltransferase